MSLRVRAYQDSDAESWDAFCASAHQATFLHTRRFLSYHGDRFQDRSLIVEESGRWVGVFPAAEQPGDERCVVSHPGLTYGGLLHKGRLMGEEQLATFSMICRHYAEQGYKRLVYKAVPWFYHQTPAQDDVYVLFRLGARRVRCDLSSTIDLQHRRPVSERRKRSLKKAQRAGIKVCEGNEYLPRFWPVLTENLKRKHHAVPVHTLAEITLLAERFPDNIRCVVAMLADDLIAGVVLFITPQVTHAQYIGSSAAGYELSALDAVFEHCIAQALREGKRWFDFGISTEDGGWVLNNSLYRFKSEFGGGGTVYEFYEIDLRTSAYEN
ncbi:MAG: GNAT family N-acetyltransferase [Candidatus Hadarchaeum sp.]